MKRFNDSDGAFLCFLESFREGVSEISRKVYKTTRKYQGMCFITNLEHIQSHHWFAFLVGKLTTHSEDSREQASQPKCPYQPELHQENRKQGGSRCFHNLPLPKGWESEGQGTALRSLGK